MSKLVLFESNNAHARESGMIGENRAEPGIMGDKQQGTGELGKSLKAQYAQESESRASRGTPATSGENRGKQKKFAGLQPSGV